MSIYLVFMLTLVLEESWGLWWLIVFFLNSSFNEFLWAVNLSHHQRLSNNYYSVFGEITTNSLLKFIKRWVQTNTINQPVIQSLVWLRKPFSIHIKSWCCQVRVAAVYALGTFINNSTERSDHANNIDHGVGRTVISVINDSSPLVRKVRLNVATNISMINFYKWCVCNLFIHTGCL